jgi:tetratricopeptide (TPR) repeat protein
LTPEQKGAALYDLAAQLFQRGLSDEGAATLERACHFPISIGTRILALGMLSKVALHRGDTETAGDLITALEEFEVHPEFGNPARRLVAQCRAAFAKEQGNEVEYAAELDAATYVAPGEELSSAERLDVFMNRARLALEESRLADAHEALDHADDLVQLQGQTTIRRAEVLLLRATIKEQEEEFVEAEELVTQALVIGRRLLPSSSPFLAHPLQRLAALAVRGSEDADVEDESNHEKLQQAYACASEALRILEDAGRKTSALVALHGVLAEVAGKLGDVEAQARHERKKRDLQWASGEEPDSGSSDF